MSKSEFWVPMPRFLLRKDAIKQLTKKIPLKDKDILEIGFGAGEMLLWFYSKGANVSGVDFSNDAYLLAKKRIIEKRGIDNIHLYTDFSQINQSYFDVVCAFEVLEHIQKDIKALEEWLSYLKPGGSLIFSVPAHMSKWSHSDEWAGHIKRYEKEEFNEIFKTFDVTIEKVWNYGYPTNFVLDKLLEKSCKNMPRDHANKIEKTKQSGIDRPKSKVINFLSKDLFLYPAYLMQRLFFKKDLGSGYLVHVRKN